jgi:hypothetical protein
MSAQSDPLAGNRMDEAAIDELLTDVGYGVLAMSRDDRPYPVPLSFGYDGEDRLYFLFVGETDEGRKLTYATAADHAAFLAYDITEEGWRSAIVEGSFQRARGKDEWDHARTAMADNAWRPDLFTEGGIEGNPRVWVLHAEEKGGRVVGQASE